MRLVKRLIWNFILLNAQDGHFIFLESMVHVDVYVDFAFERNSFKAICVKLKLVKRRYTKISIYSKFSPEFIHIMFMETMEQEVDVDTEMAVAMEKKDMDTEMMMKILIIPNMAMKRNHKNLLTLKKKLMPMIINAKLERRL